MHKNTGAPGHTLRLPAHAQQTNVGDFNYKDIDWEPMTAKIGPDSIQAQLVQTIYTQGWFQHVNFHTRF